MAAVFGDRGSRVIIGWDVGGWNCDRKPISREALVVLNGAGAKIGQRWRGNFCQAINAAASRSGDQAMVDRRMHADESTYTFDQFSDFADKCLNKNLGGRTYR